MKENQMYLINKIFNSESIRTAWNKEEEKYYISVVDIVSVLTESSDGRKYWNKLKQRLKGEGNESVTNCHQLKLKSSDGKYYKTDVCDTEGMFRLIQSIPSKNAEPLKLWLSKLGSNRVDEVFDPSISLQRAIDLYRTKGYDENWISKRIKGLQDRKQLTDVWKENGIKEGKEYANLTNEIYKTWSGMNALEYKQFKCLRKESLRDNMDSMELILSDLSEETTKRLSIKQKPYGLNENIEVARKASNIVKTTKEQLEKELDEDIITRENNLNYEYQKELN